MKKAKWILLASLFLFQDCSDLPVYFDVERIEVNSVPVKKGFLIDNASVRPSVSVTFTQSLLRDSINARTVQISKEDDVLGSSVPLNVFFQDNEKTLIVRMVSSTPDLELGTVYNFYLSRDITAVNGSRLGKNISISFKTGSESSQSSLSVFYDDTMVLRDGNDFSISVKGDQDLAAVRLQLLVSANAKLFYGRSLLQTAENQYVADFDFSDGTSKTFIVTSQDGVFESRYTVSVKESPVLTRKQIVSFSLRTAANQSFSALIDEANQTVTASVPVVIDRSRLIPTISYFGARVYPASGQVQDFTRDVLYTVYGYDGLTKDYMVRVLSH